MKVNNKQFIIRHMNKILITGTVVLFLSPIIAYIISFDCLQDHTTPLIELGEPLQKNIIAFQKENIKLTEFDQVENILLKSGCSNIKVIKYESSKKQYGVVYVKRTTYTCTFKKNELTILATMMLRESTFVVESIEASMGYGHCYLSLNKDKKIDPTAFTRSCSQSTCILPKLNLGH